MEFVNEVEEKRVLDIREVPEGEYEDKEIRMNRVAHTIRHIGEMTFVTLRRSRGLMQCIYGAGIMGFDIRESKEESTVEIMDVIKAKERALQGSEIRLKEIRVLSQSVEPLPLAVSKQKLGMSLEAELFLHPIPLRNVRERVKFRIQEGVVRGSRDYLLSRGFTEIRTPRIVARGAEGGSSVFKLECFSKEAELGQSPQFYKQTMVGVYDKVFEATPVFRAEKHNITRHLNGYISLDSEMGYIGSFRDVMNMETGMLQYVMGLLEQDYKKELDILGVILPEVGRIPAVRFDQAEELVSRECDREIRNLYGLKPEKELLVGRYFQEEYGGDSMLVIHYPSKKRPFCAVDGPTDPRFTLNFNLSFRGPGVTIGGQWTHSYREITAKVEKRDMDPEDIASYLMIFKYDVSPHGGLGIELERLTMRLLDEQSVRRASLFPRDATRLEPQGQEDD